MASGLFFSSACVLNGEIQTIFGKDALMTPTPPPAQPVDPSDLKPCPFCGHEGEQRSIHTLTWHDQFGCRICDVWFGTAARWQARAALATAQQAGVALYRDYAAGHDSTVSPIHSYMTLWEKINGTGSWVANPLVWVVEFKRITA
jgi:hypothetical protein